MRVFWDSIEPKLLACELHPLAEQRHLIGGLDDAKGADRDEMGAKKGEEQLALSIPEVALNSKNENSI